MNDGPIENRIDLVIGLGRSHDDAFFLHPIEQYQALLLFKAENANRLFPIQAFVMEQGRKAEEFVVGNSKQRRGIDLQIGSDRQGLVFDLPNRRQPKKQGDGNIAAGQSGKPIKKRGPEPLLGIGALGLFFSCSVRLGCFEQ